MAGAQAQAQAILKVSIKLVIPGIPADEEEKEFVIQDLDWMGCRGMLNTPWCVHDAQMVREIKKTVANQF